MRTPGVLWSVSPTLVVMLFGYAAIGTLATTSIFGKVGELSGKMGELSRKVGELSESRHPPMPMFIYPDAQLPTA